jgi:hypothetical protein
MKPHRLAAKHAKSKWDFFIAYASSDGEYAERLYDLLCSEARVFIDSRSLNPGDDWATVLPASQCAARVTVVLISSDTCTAYFQREEILSAIELSRKGDHRVVPVYIGRAQVSDNVPYGLRLKQALFAPTKVELDEVADQLLQLRRSRRRRVQASPVPSASSPLLTPLRSGDLDSVISPTAEVRLAIEHARLLAESWQDNYLSIPHLLAGLASAEETTLHRFLLARGVDSEIWTRRIKETIQHGRVDGTGTSTFPRPTTAWRTMFSGAAREAQVAPGCLLDERTVLASILESRGSYVSNLLGTFGLAIESLEEVVRCKPTPYIAKPRTRSD